MPVPRLGELGFRLILYPVTTLLAATAAMRGVLGVLRAEGEPPEDDDDVSFDEFVEFIGLGEISELERRFGS
jgi:2-methylisocitrate lyase-like PEP mutase family enzyme